jgi:hypothetical protein
MERPNFDMLSERLDIDIADRTESDSSIGFKSLHQAFALDFLIELLLDGNKHLRWHTLELNFGRKTNLFTVNRLVDRRTFNGVRDQDIADGQQMVRSGTYFSQNKGTMMKTNCMAIGGDLKF